MLFIISGTYIALAEIVLFLHGLFIAWVALGVLLTRDRPVLRWLHIASLCWGIAVEVLPWMCPLTLLENWLESRAGVQPYQGGFLLHCLDKLVYPEVSVAWLTVVAVIVCAANLGFYAWQLVRAKTQKNRPTAAYVKQERTSDLQ
jgi:threonine/homoserine/homoserine lactone efflux protein